MGEIFAEIFFPLLLMQGFFPCNTSTRIFLVDFFTMLNSIPVYYMQYCYFLLSNPS